MGSVKVRRPTGPLNEVFGDPRTTKILDFLLLQPEHQTKSEIKKGTKVPNRVIENIITNLLDNEIVSTGAQMINEKTHEAENTYHVSKLSPSGKAIIDLHETVRQSRLLAKYRELSPFFFFGC